MELSCRMELACMWPDCWCYNILQKWRVLLIVICCMNCVVNDGHFEFPAFICMEDVYYLVYVHGYTWVNWKILDAFKKKLVHYKHSVLDNVTRMKVASLLTFSLPIARWRLYDHSADYYNSEAKQRWRQWWQRWWWWRQRRQQQQKYMLLSLSESEFYLGWQTRVHLHDTSHETHFSARNPNL